MEPAPINCPACGGGLTDTQGKMVVTCPFCGIDVTLSLTPVQSMVRALERRAELEPRMNRLMERYAEHLVAGDKHRALAYYEAFTYLVCSISYAVEDLSSLEAMVTPLMRDVARQLGAEYTPPIDRGERVTHASIDSLIG